MKSWITTQFMVVNFSCRALFSVAAALGTTCLNWQIDLLESTKLIIALKALPLTQQALWFVKKLLNVAFAEYPDLRSTSARVMAVFSPSINISAMHGACE